MTRATILTLTAVLAAAPAPAAPRTNLLLVTADDMNADSPGFMGDPFAATPNLDQFAAAAVRFERCHVTAPICQPSRSAFMTGRVPHRNGALGFNPIRKGVPTLVQVMRDNGYFTAGINKLEHMMPREQFPWDLALSGSGKDPVAFRKHVEQCLAAAKEKGKPFFINANITDPHRPFPGGVVRNPARQAVGATPKRVYKPEEIKVPSFLDDLPDLRKEVAQYYTAVARFDHTFGETLDALAKVGHADDTLVVFLSDHGMSFPFSKATVYRNGTWSPVLFRGPGLTPLADRTHYVSSVDILPTVLELLGLPPLAGIDGRSWVPLIRGESQPDRDFVVTHVNTVSSGKSFAQRCVRTAAHSYLWMGWPNGTPQFRVEAMSGLSFNAMKAAGTMDERMAARVKQLVVGEREQFFDLRADPGERKNLIHDPASQAELARLRRLLLQHMRRTDDPQIEAFKATLDRK